MAKIDEHPVFLKLADNPYFIKIFSLLLVLIIGLVGTVWAITWKSTQKQVSENTETIKAIGTFVEVQKNINQNQDKINEEMKELNRQVAVILAKMNK